MMECHAQYLTNLSMRHVRARLQRRYYCELSSERSKSGSTGRAYCLIDHACSAPNCIQSRALLSFFAQSTLLGKQLSTEYSVPLSDWI